MENFVRKIGKNDSFIYNHEVRTYAGKDRILKKRQISAREYIEMCEGQRLSGMKELKKFRQCFIHEQQYFMVETFLNIDGTPSFLRIETDKDQSEIQIPPFIKILKEVTEDDMYAGSSMAKNIWRMPDEDKKNSVIRQGTKTQRPQSATKRTEQKDAKETKPEEQPPVPTRQDSGSTPKTEKPRE